MTALAVEELQRVRGVTRDCEHPIAHHSHGTRNAFILDKCGCAPCYEANRLYECDRRRHHMYAEWNPELSATATHLVDAQPVRNHVAALSAAGMGWKRVAEVAGVANGTMYAILYGKGSSDPSERRPPRHRVRQETAEKILAVGINLRDGALVDSTGSARRLQALVARGWSQSQLGRRLGVLPSNMSSLMHGRRKTTSARRDAVTALYDELWDQPPPEETWHQKTAATRSRNRARDLGWLPPLAWDDDQIDDPEARPRGLLQPSSRDDIREIEHLLNAGEHPSRIAARLDTRASALARYLYRHGRNDLAVHFNQTLRSR